MALLRPRRGSQPASLSEAPAPPTSSSSASTATAATDAFFLLWLWVRLFLGFLDWASPDDWEEPRGAGATTLKAWGRCSDCPCCISPSGLWGDTSGNSTLRQRQKAAVPRPLSLALAGSLLRLTLLGPVRSRGPLGENTCVAPCNTDRVDAPTPPEPWEAGVARGHVLRLPLPPMRPRLPFLPYPLERVQLFNRFDPGGLSEPHKPV